MKRIVALAAIFGLAGLASAKEVYVAADSSVLTFDAADPSTSGVVVTAGAGGLSRATGLVQGPDGDIYVASPLDDSILVFDGVNGAFVGVFIDENDRLRGPAGITFGPNGNLYVANRFRNEVVEYDASGAIVHIFTASTGVDLLTPEAVAFGVDGQLYIADANHNRIMRVDPASFVAAEFVPASEGLDYPHGLAFDSTGVLFVSSHFGNEVLGFAADGTGLGQFAAVSEPVGVAVGDNDEVFIVSFGSAQLAHFAADGTLLSTTSVSTRSSFASIVDRPVLASLSRTPSAVFGSCQNSTVTATLDRPAPSGGVVIAVTSSNAAIAVPPTVIIPAGATSVAFAATSSAVATQVVAEVRASTFGVSRSTFVTVKPIGLASGVDALVLTPASVTGGSTATGRVTLFCPAVLSDVSVSLSSSLSGVAAVPASVVVPVGQAFADFTITTTAPVTSTTVVVSAVLDRTQSRNLVVTQSATISSVVLALTSFTGGASTSGTVNLSAPAPVGGLTVLLSTNIAQATVPASVVVAEGAASATFALSSTAVAASSAGTVTARLGASVGSRNFTLRPIPVIAVALSPSTVLSGQTSTGTVTLEFAAAPGNVVVNLSSQSPGVAVPATATVTVLQGQTTASFVVQAGTVTARQTARIVAQAQGSTQSKFAILTVNP